MDEYEASAGLEIGDELLRSADGFGRVLVVDLGPGFNLDQVIGGLSGAGSTGLGLDIARRSAEVKRRALVTL